MSGRCSERIPNVDRLLAAFRHERLDGIPNFEIMMDKRALSHLLGAPVEQGLWALPAEQAVKALVAVGQDALPCSLHAQVREASILTKDDVDRLVIQPDPKFARERLRPCLDAVAGTTMGVCVCITGPLTSTYMACGPVAIESFMYLLYDDAPLVERLMDMFVDYYLAVIDATADMPFHFYYIGDDLGGSTGPLIGPGHLTELWAPRARKLVAAAKATGRPVMFHCCGDQSSVLPFLVEWGVDAVHPIQPNANDIYAIHKQYGDKLALVGNIDAGGVLTFGTPQEVAQDTREHIARLAGGNGYVVGSSHSIIDSIPPENYLAMIEAAQAAG